MSSSARRRTCCGLSRPAPATHVRLAINPDGGLAGRRPYERPARLDALFTSGELPGLGAAAGRVRPRMILTDRARSLVHWCDRQRSKISGEKIGTATRRKGS
jgi:hypothetical protein